MPLNKSETFERTEDLIGELRASGLKVTEQRVLVLGELAGDCTHPTAQELFERIKDRHPGISFATVYNTLNALERARRIAALDVGGPRRFDPNRARHDHAICDRCGSVRDVDPVDASLPDPMLDGFAVERIERVYRGLCSECGTSSEASNTDRRNEDG
jgi:Fur family peroxide stress response transcriptional regulator